MDFKQLKTFKTVAVFLNFNQAARALNYSQSTISAQIRALEEDVGKPLFDRLGRRIALTDAGRVLLRYGEKLLSLQKETLAQVSNIQDSKGVLSIRAPQSVSTYYLPQVIERFNRNFPSTSIDISTCAYHELQQELRSGITDVAFLLTEMIASRELRAELLNTERLILVAAPDHQLSARQDIGWKNLKDQTLLMPKHDCAYKMVFEQQLSKAKVHAGTVIEYNSVEGIKQCLIRGVGLSVLPEVAVRREIETGQLAALPWGEGPLESGLLMIWHKDKWLSPALSAFMASARRTMSDKE